MAPEQSVEPHAFLRPRAPAALRWGCPRARVLGCSPAPRAAFVGPGSRCLAGEDARRMPTGLGVFHPPHLAAVHGWSPGGPAAGASLSSCLMSFAASRALMVPTRSSSSIACCSGSRHGRGRPRGSHAAHQSGTPLSWFIATPTGRGWRASRGWRRRRVRAPRRSAAGGCSPR